MWEEWRHRLVRRVVGGTRKHCCAAMDFGFIVESMTGDGYTTEIVAKVINKAVRGLCGDSRESPVTTTVLGFGPTTIN